MEAWVHESHGGRVERGRAERAGMHWGPLKSLIGSRGIGPENHGAMGPGDKVGGWPSKHADIGGDGARGHGGMGPWGPWRSRAGGRVERGKGGASGAGGAGGHALGPFKVI